ncbi:polysaccharide deacetylase family protein [Blastochloris tepida]|uniref:Chitooligosaccharide deacetylase n=1 Tax=Blastochloris tepida TaxID=2233851 RepID=A0A348G0E0_9HYPH|nr:polysaccharide deacetylase family protein [Blastochloris tepida]BBF93023.1 polysaccharide deacetylase [Blastochloris tepida]
MRPRFRLAAILLLALAGPSLACGPESLGTRRVLAVETAGGVRVGTKSYPATLPLADKEVVLTFDDGPWPGTTQAVLDSLARECVRATFFLIGENAEARPALVRRMIADGHTVGHHTWSHPILSKIPAADALGEIERGIAADDRAAYGSAAPVPRVAFFRFPGFADTPELLDRLAERKIAVFGADLWASDWKPMTPQAQLDLVMKRLNETGRGIVLFHDTKRQTADMLPAFLRALKDGGYAVVHIIPAHPQAGRSLYRSLSAGD